jgi:hypothetical protein
MNWSWTCHSNCCVREDGRGGFAVFTTSGVAAKGILTLDSSAMGTILRPLCETEECACKTRDHEDRRRRSKRGNPEGTISDEEQSEEGPHGKEEWLEWREAQASENAKATLQWRIKHAPAKEPDVLKVTGEPDATWEKGWLGQNPTGTEAQKATAQRWQKKMQTDPLYEKKYIPHSHWGREVPLWHMKQWTHGLH